jgi:phosphate-selective porin OprO and OprP
MKTTNSFLIFLMSVLVISTIEATAQRETDEKAFINFKDGVGFLAPDSLFGMNIRFRMQNRIGMTFEEGWDDSEFEATVKRCRLRFDGFIRDTKLTYYMQLSFSRGDQDWDNSHVPNVIRDAMVYYKFHPHFYIGMGQGKLPGNRQRVTSSGSQQFTDRSVVNATFNIDRDFGIFAYYNNTIGKNFTWVAKGAVSTGDGRNILKTDNGLAYTGRLEILPFGNFTHKGDYFEGDIERESSPKLSIAGSYSLNQNAVRTAGQRGTDLYEARDIETIFADLMLKYNGWCLTGEYAQRNSDNPVTFNTEGDYALIQTGKGYNTQLSYLFKNNYELAGRYSMIDPSEQMNGFDMPIQNIYTFGITKYICEHRTKLQLNISRIIKEHNLLIDKTKEWNAMIQIEIGI